MRVIVVSGTTSAKPLVLSPQDFQRLASQGVLRFSQPQNTKKPLPIVTNGNNSSLATSKVLPINNKPKQPETIDYGAVPPTVKDELDVSYDIWLILLFDWFRIY